MRRFLAAFVVSAILLASRVCAFAELQNAGGVLKYYDENGKQASQIGIDVSYYNNQIDWQALKAQGFDFAIIRLGGRGWGSGRLYGDRMTQSYLRGARDAGIQIGAYFYSTARNPAEAAEEAQAALYELNGLSLDFPVFIDMETSGDYPNGRSDTLSPGERASVIETFCRTIASAGYQTGLYASEGYCRFNLDYDAVSQFPLWLASYTVDNRLPQYIDGYALWQQTDSAYAGGIDGSFDLDLILR